MLRLLILALAVLHLPHLAQAQTAVSEQEFLRVLEQDFPALQALSDRLGVARAERSEVGLLENPVAFFEREAPKGGADQNTWGLAWKPPLDWRRGAEKRAASAGLEAATHHYESDRLALRANLRSAYADWAISEARSTVAEAHLALVRDLARQMRARASTGEESQLAARRLALSAVEVEAEAAVAAGAAVRARSFAYALRPGLPAEATPDFPPLPEPIDTLQTAAPPELLARASEVEQAEWLVKSGDRFLQFPEIAFGWQWIDEPSATLDGPVFGVSWPVPLFDRQQPDRIRATAQLKAAEARLSLAQARAEADLLGSRVAFQRFHQAALEAMEIAGEGDQVVESATAAFRAGESRLTDLLETLRSVLAARFAALDLYDAALEAHRSLELAAGRPLTEEGGTR